MSDAIQPFFLRHPASSGLHLFWCLWSFFAAAVMVRLAGRHPLKRRTVLIFGASMVLLYGASGIYHGIPRSLPVCLEIFRKLDHSAIYLLIAGTYTPIFAVLLRGWLRPTLLVLLWGLALVGIGCKWLLPWPPYQLTVALYVGMGWIGLVPAWALVRAVGVRAMVLGLAGGLSYTLGAVCEALSWPTPWPGVFGYHEILHVSDMLGTLAHVVFVMRYVLPYPLPGASSPLSLPLQLAATEPLGSP
jgi:hemolysin III